MPKFDLDIPHVLPVPEARTRLGRAKAKLEQEYGVTCTWEGEDRLLVTRKGLKASVSVEAARLRVDVDIGFLLSPLSGAIRAGITKQLTELVA
jgi:putative polyhydroxyalkanoate system protein